MLKKRILIPLIYIFLLLFSLLIAGAAIIPPLPANDGTWKCKDNPDRFDDCRYYPDCWLNGGCTTEKPTYDFLNNHDYECRFVFWSMKTEYYEKSTTSCPWQKCDGDTLIVHRNCGLDGYCSHGTSYDCNNFDGTYNIPQCRLGSDGDGPLEEEKICVSPSTIDGYIHDYGCVNYASLGSARCEKKGAGIPNCGDDMIVKEETCDGTNLNSQTCISQGFTGGTLKCSSDCKSFDTSECCMDNDKDGYGSPASSSCTYSTLDCDDNDATKWQYLNGYTDSDTDGYGTGSVLSICSGASLPSGYSTNSDDCNDNNANINPGATEVCNNMDDNCNKEVDDGFNKLTDVNNCGSCGKVCGVGETCEDGKCKSVCTDACYNGYWVDYADGSCTVLSRTCTLSASDCCTLIAGSGAACESNTCYTAFSSNTCGTGTYDNEVIQTRTRYNTDGTTATDTKIVEDCAAAGKSCSKGECVSCITGQTQSCGKCGTRTCTAFGTWGACKGEGVCTPNTKQSCGTAGTKTCSSFCLWGACQEPVSCTAGTRCVDGKYQSCSGGFWVDTGTDSDTDNVDQQCEDATCDNAYGICDTAITGKCTAKTATETICNDNIDNDCDKNTDCSDSDCAANCADKLHSLKGLNVPIISMSGYATKDIFQMADSYASANAAVFTLMQPNNQIVCTYSGNINVYSSSQPQSAASALKNDVSLIAKLKGTPNDAGIALLPKDARGVNDPVALRLHFSAAKGDALTNEGSDLFIRTVKYAMGEPLTCPQRCAVENTVALCSDAIDNDCDGKIDCADTDCAGTISGSVKDTNNNPIDSAKIDVLKNAALVHTTYTNALGNYLVNNNLDVICGSYDIIASASQYVSSTKSNINLPPRTSITVDFTGLILGTTCEDDCTYVGDNIIHKECDGIDAHGADLDGDGRTDCDFYDNTAKEVCNFAQPGWIRSYDTAYEIECAEGAPMEKKEVKAVITCEQENLIKLTKLVAYKGKLVKLVVVACG